MLINLQNSSEQAHERHSLSAAVEVTGIGVVEKVVDVVPTVLGELVDVIAAA